MIIPNVKLENFKNMLKKNFFLEKYKNCIVYNKIKIFNLPKIFHLFA